MSDEPLTIQDLLGLESFVGLVTGGYSNPSDTEFGEDVPAELIAAWQAHYDASVKLKAELQKVKS